MTAAEKAACVLWLPFSFSGRFPVHSSSLPPRTIRGKNSENLFSATAERLDFSRKLCYII